MTRMRWRATTPRNPTSQTQAETYLVKRAIDGDTIELSTGERVRLIGVDTPETKDPRKAVQYFGKEAAAFTRRMVEGKRVRLECDWERKDKYGRTPPMSAGRTAPSSLRDHPAGVRVCLHAVPPGGISEAGTGGEGGGPGIVGK